MRKNNLTGVIIIFFSFGFIGCDVLTGERYPIPSGNYEVPQAQQLQRGGDYFANKAPQQSTIVGMRQEVPFNWKD